MTVRFFEEMRRHYYVTPSSYLELLKQYKNLLEKKTKQTTQMRDRIQNGLTVSDCLQVMIANLYNLCYISVRLYQSPYSGLDGGKITNQCFSKVV